mgnify:CR=1 FL=1|jgi:hypothetical protein
MVIASQGTCLHPTDVTYDGPPQAPLTIGIVRSVCLRCDSLVPCVPGASSLHFGAPFSGRIEDAGVFNMWSLEQAAPFTLAHPTLTTFQSHPHTTKNMSNSLPNSLNFSDSLQNSVDLMVDLPSLIG